MASDTAPFFGISGDTVVVLVSVAAGWILSQLTDVVKPLIAGFRHRKGLLEELKDIAGQLNLIELALRRQLHIAALGGIDASGQLRLFNYYFQSFYKDAFQRLNSAQRLSYQLIHGFVDAFNRDVELFPQYVRATVEQIQTSTPEDRERLGRLWIDRIAAAYSVLRTMQWHVAYHLDNAVNPALPSAGPVHEAYGKMQDGIRNDVEKIIESSSSMSLEDFAFRVGHGTTRRGEWSPPK